MEHEYLLGADEYTWHAHFIASSLHHWIDDGSTAENGGLTRNNEGLTVNHENGRLLRENMWVHGKCSGFLIRCRTKNILVGDFKLSTEIYSM